MKFAEITSLWQRLALDDRQTALDEQIWPALSRTYDALIAVNEQERALLELIRTELRGERSVAT